MAQADHFAGLWPRFLALLLDIAVLGALFFPVTRIVKGTWLLSPADHRWVSGWFITDPLCLLFLVAIVLYFILFEGIAGATPGKRIMGIMVISSEGRPPGLIKSAVRNLLRIVDSLPAFNILGIILIVRSPECARFGDRVAGTRVVFKRHRGE